MGVRKPWFPFWVDDFWQDEAVQAMSLEEAGLYIRLLSLQWREGSIPADADRIARIVGVSREAIGTLWPALQDCFRPVENDDTRLVNPRLTSIADHQTAVHQNAVESGRRGGLASQGGLRQPQATSKGASTDPQPYRESESKDQQDPPIVPPEGEPGDATKPSRPKKRREPTTPPPNQFEPSNADMAWFRGKFGEVPVLEIREQTELFLNHHRAKGNQFLDWHAAWKTWMQNWRSDFGRKTPGGPAPRPPPRANPNMVQGDE